MLAKSVVTDTFNCSTERAFKAPILGDATKFLNGYLFQPPITGFEEDETWGKINGIRYPLTDGNIMVPKGRLITDVILDRVENQYWKWCIYDFNSNALFFTTKAIGEWSVKKNEDGNIDVKYTYTYHSKNIFCQPLNWLFTNIQIRGMMKKAMRGIKELAESNCEFVYEKKRDH